MASAIEEIKKLEAKKRELLEQAKAEALEQAEEAITTLNALGFPYKLTGGPKQPRGTRRSGIRDAVLEAIEAHPNGINRADLLVGLGVKGDKKGEQSVSNALSALKKAEQISGEDGLYKVI